MEGVTTHLKAYTLSIVWVVCFLFTYVNYSFDSQWLKILLKTITLVIPVYIFLFRIRNAFLMKSIKSINDLLIKTNEKCIDIFLDESPEKNIKDIKKVNLYLSYIKAEILNFPFGGPISSLLIFILGRFGYYKKYEQEAMSLYAVYHELITMDTVIENKTAVMNIDKSDILMDDIIHVSTKLSNNFESHLKKYF